MEDNQQITIPKKIKYKFLSYQYYSMFRRDLDSNRILDDAIVFIKDVRRIWARGSEYSCDTQVKVQDGAIVISDADGNVILNELFAKKSDLEDFEDAIRSINDNLNHISLDLVSEHNRAVGKELELEDRINSIGSISSGSGDSSVGLMNALNLEIAIRANEDSSIRQQLSAANSEISRIDQRVATEETTARAIEATLLTSINSDLIHSVDYVKNEKLIYFKNINGETIDTVNCSDFVIDGMISDVKIVTQNNTKYLDIEWNTDGGGRHIQLPVGDIIHSVGGEGQSFIAGNGIDIDEDVISVKDYIGESSVNAKLKILQQMLAQMYVLKADVYDKNRPQTWSNATIYSFDGISTSDEGSSAAAKGNLVIMSNGMFNIISENEELRNDVCYFITDDEMELSGGYEILENAGIMAVGNQVFNSLLEGDLVRNDVCYLITVQ